MKTIVLLLFVGYLGICIAGKSKSDSSKSSSSHESRSDSGSLNGNSDEENPGSENGSDSGEDEGQGYEYISVHEGLVLRPEDPPKDLISMNYPDEAPGDLRQSWSIRAWSADGPTHLKITCEEFNLPLSEPCEHFELMIDDGEERHNFCGEKNDFSFTSKSEGAGILLATGPQGGGKIKCSAQAVKAQ